MLLEVRDLSFHYPDGTAALDGLSFNLADGECVGLAGPNGAGKSTLLWHLNGLLPDDRRTRTDRNGAGQGRGGQLVSGPVATAPAIRVDGFTVEEPNLAAIRRTVGLVFQDPDDQLFCPTLREDVAFGPLSLGLGREEALKRVAETLQAVGLSGLEHKLPHHLSVGQRKRACLAGVLACQPRLLALDEPTANLDPRGRRQLMAILQDLSCAKLIASHDLDMLLELCSRVILLDEGRIQADGPVRTILGEEALLLKHGLEVPAGLRFAT